MPWESRPVVLTAKQSNDLKEVARSTTSSEKEKVRALIVLLLGQGLKNKEIGKKLSVHENTVVKWRGRWTGDNEASKIIDYGELTGRPRNILIPEMLEKIRKTSQTRPPSPAQRWPVRKLATKFQLPVATMQRALVELDINLYSTITD